MTIGEPALTPRAVTLLRLAIQASLRPFEAFTSTMVLPK
jgi:hypothetical protein